jgi:prephenate dehydrogenase
LPLATEKAKSEALRVLWGKITLVGIGLLGGSLGLAIRQRRLASTVAGYVRREATVAESLKAGAVDAAGLDLEQMVSGAGLVILCTPISQMRDLTARMLPALAPGALVTDVGSVKSSVARELEPLVASAGAHFIGSHPMAGAEKMGVSAARADLYDGAICVVTPTDRSPASLVGRLEAFWRGVGALPLRMAASRHDELVCRSSHLPHIVAVHLAHYILDPAHPEEQARLCASGFRDTTRIASGSPEMWRDICTANRENLARELDVFIDALRHFRGALTGADEPKVAGLLDQAKQRRDAWCAQAASSSSE